MTGVWRALPGLAALAFAFAFACASAAAAFEPPRDWSPLDAAVRAQVAAAAVPGAVVALGDAQHPWLLRAWGRSAVLPDAQPMSADTVFDLASLTKVVCTTTAVLQLVQRGRLALDEPVARDWPAFAQRGKQAVTVRQLLTHASGLREGLAWPADAPRRGAQELVEQQSLLHAPGTRRLYSDINFIALGLLVERVARTPLDRYCREHVFEPLEMRDTRFRPGRAYERRTAPTEQVQGQWLRGTVQDPTARRMGGVAGHAGLFGTARDLARFAQALLLRDPRLQLSPATIDAMLRPQGEPGEHGAQGLGWLLDAPLVAARERLAPRGVAWHTGYTGTALWIDFEQQRYVIVLSSRLHAQAGDARPLRRQVIALVSSLSPPRAEDAPAATPSPSPPPMAGGSPVRTGLDVLREDGWELLRGRRVGLVTNISAVDAQGWRAIDRLRHAPGVTLVRVFSPEHGLYGDLEGRIASGVEPFSGVPLESLYGRVLRPTPAMLEGIDTLVFDMQDAGARFYTYASTLRESMAAAADAGLRIVVLDRPNPLGGERVSGPMLDEDLQSFTATAPMPVQHGMTLGELALFLRERVQQAQGRPVDLQVVPMQGWRRGMQWLDTRLDWVPPSPNLRRPVTALLYPGAAWVEGANVSVGRGTEHPFEWVGAPWIDDGERLASALRALAVPGLEVQAVAFRPQDGPWRGTDCRGVALRVSDRAAFDAPLLGAALVASLYRLWPDVFRIERTIGMVGSRSSLELLRSGLDAQGLRELQARWAREREGFVGERARALLY